MHLKWMLWSYLKQCGKSYSKIILSWCKIYWSSWGEFWKTIVVDYKCLVFHCKPRNIKSNPRTNIKIYTLISNITALASFIYSKTFMYNTLGVFQFIICLFFLSFPIRSFFILSIIHFLLKISLKKKWFIVTELF